MELDLDLDLNFVSNLVEIFIDNLPNKIKHTETPIEIDLVLDGGVFNASFTIGALYFLKEMEKQNIIKIKRISGCSIGSVLGLLYLIDKLDLTSSLYKKMVLYFKKKYNLKIYKNLKKLLKGEIPENVCDIVNDRLYVTYNNVITGEKKVKSNFSNEKKLFETIVRSSFCPFIIDNNITYLNKYVDGINPYIFEPLENRKILFLDLSGMDKLSYKFSIKNEKTNLYRLVSGIIDIHIFFTKNSETFMCSYVNDWSYTYKLHYRLRLIFEKMLCLFFFILLFLKKCINNTINADNIFYKLFTTIFKDIYILLISNYCV
jgi:hypothetical protein